MMHDPFISRSPQERDLYRMQIPLYPAHATVCRASPCEHDTRAVVTSGHTVASRVVPPLATPTRCPRVSEEELLRRSTSRTERAVAAPALCRHGGASPARQCTLQRTASSAHASVRAALHSMHLSVRWGPGALMRRASVRPEARYAPEAQRRSELEGAQLLQDERALLLVARREGEVGAAQPAEGAVEQLDHKARRARVCLVDGGRGAEGVLRPAVGDRAGGGVLGDDLVARDDELALVGTLPRQRVLDRVKLRRRLLRQGRAHGARLLRLDEQPERDEVRAALADVLGEHRVHRHALEQRREPPLVVERLHEQRALALEQVQVLRRQPARDVQPAQRDPLERRHARLRAVRRRERVHRQLAQLAVRRAAAL
mmetsp:Transcript_24816/g.66639  ORF Transcript_24816/g.66639 Transcript_24816/m.66639 type:complete len:372 (+) Transcript_24816:127-1242(+)